MAKEKIIFYAWQSWSPNETNRRAIRRALESVCKKLKTEFASQELTFNLQEATRDEPGSPNIPATILRKIETSDVFVGDLTTVVEQTTSPRRVSPNPNVVFELGFAVAHLGWPRVIMVFNQALGVLGDLPFDIGQQRVSSYRIPEPTDAKQSIDKTGLESLLVSALRMILRVNPAKPAELKGLSVTEVRRRRDIESLRSLLSTVDWLTIDKQIQEGPYIIRSKVFDVWYEFDFVFSNTVFHLYDKSLRSKLSEFHRLWEETLSYPDCYLPTKNGDLIFLNDMFWTKQHRTVFRNLRKTYPSLSAAKKAFVDEVSKKHVGIDLKNLSKLARSKYR